MMPVYNFNLEEKKVMIVFGTRPELIKLIPLLIEIDNSELRRFFITVYLTQHTSMIEDQLNFWNIQPDVTLTITRSKLTQLLSSSLTQLQELSDQLPSLKYVLIQGDTNTALSVSNFTFLNQLKLLHLEAGLRSQNLSSPFPEEYNRLIASKVAYFHFAPSENAKQNLLNEGVRQDDIMVTGNTGIDALKLALSKTGMI